LQSIAQHEDDEAEAAAKIEYRDEAQS